MDHDGRNAAALQADTVLAAKVVAAIPELERDYRLAHGPLSDRFMAEVQSSMRVAAPDSWEVVPHDWTIILRDPGWKPSRGLGNGDMWLQISEIADDDVERTWLGVAIGAGGNTRLGLELLFRNALKGPAAVVTTEKTHADRLKKIGFRTDEDGGRLFVPIVIDRMRLSKGYSENDLSDALLPVREVAATACAAKLDLDALIEAVRTKARGK